MNSDQLRRSLREKWLDYYRDNRLWVSRLAVWTDVSGERRPVSSFIVATLSVLEPNLAHLLPLIVDLSSDPDRVVEALGLDFDPEALMGVPPEVLAGRPIRPEVLPASHRAPVPPLQTTASVPQTAVPQTVAAAPGRGRVRATGPIAGPPPEAVHVAMADRRPDTPDTNGHQTASNGQGHPQRDRADEPPAPDNQGNLGPRPIATPPTPRMATPPRHSRPDDHNDWELIDRRPQSAPKPPAPRTPTWQATVTPDRATERPAPTEQQQRPASPEPPRDRADDAPRPILRDERDDDTCEGRTRDRAATPPPLAAPP